MYSLFERLIIPVLVLCSALTNIGLAAGAVTDDRVLVVQDGDETRRYPVAELVAAIGTNEMKVPNDPHFGADRVFSGFELQALLRHIGLDNAPELLLVCTDGYSIPLAAEEMRQKPLRALLALRDTALPTDGDRHWLPYMHGSETVDFDPFYLVWARQSGANGADAISLSSEQVPWPFQLTKISRFDREAYFSPARPPRGGAKPVRDGFAVYTAHCGKCHRMRGVGGSVGPELDRENSMSSVMTEEQLYSIVEHSSELFPRSKMPAFNKRLSPSQIEQVVAYLKSMQVPQ